jgi:hypothetical protein
MAAQDVSMPNIEIIPTDGVARQALPVSDLATDFLATLAAGNANVLLLDKTLTKAASDSAYLVTLIQKLVHAVTASAVGQENTVSFFLGKYGVSMMTRLLLMIDYDSDWGEAASDALDRVRAGLTSYNFDKLNAMLGDVTVTADIFASHAHSKITLSKEQKSTLAEAFVRRYAVVSTESIESVRLALFEGAKQPMDFDLRVAIMREYAKTEAGLIMLLAYTTKGAASDVLLMGLSQKTLASTGRTFALARQWISGDHGALLLKAMYVKTSEATQLFIGMLGQDYGTPAETPTGRAALVSIGTGLTQAMAQGTDQGTATKGLIRDIIVATEPIPAEGELGGVLLQHTLMAGHFSGDILKETALLNGLSQPVTFGDLLDKMVTAGHAIRVNKEPVAYAVVRDDSLVAALDALAVDTYGVSTGKSPRVVASIIQRFNLRPLYDALVSFMATDLNFSLKNGVYTWVSGQSEGTVNPFLLSLEQRLADVVKHVPARVIGSSGRKKYEKLEKKEARRPSLSPELREAYSAAFESFASGKMSFADLMQVMARNGDPTLREATSTSAVQRSGTAL